MSQTQKTALAILVLELSPLPKTFVVLMLFFVSDSLLAKHMEYIHGTSQMTKSYRVDVSQIRNTGYFGFEINSICQKSM